MLTVGSLFAGIGGFDLGLERTGGFKVVWQCEIDPYCQRVLAKRWPGVKRYGDIRELTDVERVDVLCGGFPCQDISNAGKRAGIDGERSGLWSEYVRIIRLVRPRYVVVENVAALLGRGIGRVLGDLSESGYDAEWDVIPASSIGAPHRRERVWLVAYPSGSRGRSGGRPVTARAETSYRGPEVAYTNHEGLEGWTQALRPQKERGTYPRYIGAQVGGIRRDEWWSAEPDVGRVANGVPNRVDRLKGLGNAIVPQIATWIGERILEHERRAV